MTALRVSVIVWCQFRGQSVQGTVYRTHSMTLSASLVPGLCDPLRPAGYGWSTFRGTTRPLEPNDLHHRNGRQRRAATSAGLDRAGRRAAARSRPAPEGRPRWYRPGLAVSLAGMLARLWVLGSVRSRKLLPVNGPHRFVRNAGYIAGFVFIFGLVLMAGDPTMFCSTFHFTSFTHGTASAGTKKPWRSGSAPSICHTERKCRASYRA